MSLITPMLSETCTISRKTVTKDANNVSIDNWTDLYTKVKCAIFSHALYRQRITQWISKQIPTDVIRIGFYEANIDIQSGDRVTSDIDGTVYHVAGPPEPARDHFRKAVSHLEVPFSMEPL